MLCAAAAYYVFAKPTVYSKGLRNTVIIFSTAVGILYYGVYFAVTCSKLLPYEGEYVSVELTVSEAGAKSGENRLYTGSCTLPGGERTNLAFFASYADAVRGDILTVEGVISVPKNTAAFNTKDYYASKGIFLTLSSAKIINVRSGQNPLYSAAAFLREYTAARIRLIVPSDEGELLIGMLFGNSFSALPDKTQSLLYRSGIGHITAVSGMHLSIAASIASFICSAARLGRKTTAVCVYAVSAFFVLISDMSVSVLRGAVMVAVVYTAIPLMRKSDSLTSLAAAAVILTIFTPYVIRNTGFLLSLSGVYGTGVLAPILTDRIEKRKNAEDLNPETLLKKDNHRISGILRSLCVCFCASAATFPAAVLSFDEVSAVAPLTNLLLSPFINIALILGLLGITLIPIGFISSGLFLSAAVFIKPVIALSCFIGKLGLTAIPLGTPVTAPLTIISLIAAAAVILGADDKLYLHLTIAACIFITVTAISLYRIAPVKGTSVQILSSGSGCVIVCHDGSSAQIIDLCGTKTGTSMAGSYLLRNGIPYTDAVILTKNCEYTAQLYRQTLYNADEILMTVSAESISDISQAVQVYQTTEASEPEAGGILVFANEYYADITINGARLLYVSKTGKVPPDDSVYDMVIYGSKKDIGINSDIYVITNSSFSGSLPADRYTERGSCSFTIADGAISAAEENIWLK